MTTRMRAKKLVKGRVYPGFGYTIAAALQVACGSDPSESFSTTTTGDVRQALVAGAESRREEVARYLEEKYFSRFTVLATTEGPFGETVDWVDPHELDPDVDDAVPPKVDAPPPTEPPEDAARGEESDYAFRDLWEEAHRKAPSGSVAIIRPNFREYIEGISPEGGELPGSVEEFVRSQSHPQPSGVEHLYSGKRHIGANTSVANGWFVYRRFSDVPSGAFSLTQSALACSDPSTGDTAETVEMGVIVHPTRYGDSLVHLFTYFTVVGYDNVGDYEGGWDQDFAGFVPCTSDCTDTHANSAFPPGSALPTPPDGGNRRRLWTQRSGSRWWVRDEISSGAFTWLGYYPIGTGSNQVPYSLMASTACRVSWYGETYDPSPTTWTNADQGNGIKGSATGSFAMWDLLNATTTATRFASTNDYPTNDLDCYNTSAGTFNSSQSTFRYGGPGGNDPNCP